MLSTRCSLVKLDKKEKRVNIKEKQLYFIAWSIQTGRVEINYTECIGVKSMGKAYNARAADGYYDQFLEILYYVYIYIFPRLAKKKKKKKKKVLFSQNHNYKS